MLFQMKQYNFLLLIPFKIELSWTVNVIDDEDERLYCN
jgi:hypothetical protein